MTDSAAKFDPEYFEGYIVPDADKVGKAGKGSAILKDQRIQRLYKRQLEGLPVRQLVLDHAAKEHIAENTAWQDWKAVREWSNKDWEFDKEDLIPRLQHLRINLFYRAVKKGQLQTAAQILDSLGKVVGESVETININAPELKIKIEDKE